MVASDAAQSWMLQNHDRQLSSWVWSKASSASSDRSAGHIFYFYDEMPTITDTPSAITTNTDSNSATAAVSWTDPTASDNSGAVTLTSDATSGSNFPIGTNTVTFTATDPSGNQATVSFTITVTDAETPTITGTPSAITTDTDSNSATAAVSWIDPTASDNSGAVTLTSDATSGSNFPIGTNTVTFTATDPSGNQATDSFTITVTDLGETMSVTGVQIQGRADSGQWVTYFKVQYSNDGSSWTYVQQTNNEADMIFDGSTNQHTVVTNLFPAEVTAAYIRIVPTAWRSHISMRFEILGCQDTEIPTITDTPSAITTNTDSNSATAAVSWTDPTASDNSGTVTLTSDATSGSNFPIGTNTVTFTATDPSGNQATVSFTITVSGMSGRSVEEGWSTFYAATTLCSWNRCICIILIAVDFDQSCYYRIVG
ncbi:hyalin-like [Amphiura filiformis]|uniref:hyalin-like n=1 Tax=Amphiura filiformis TaxID=82378 RepID=UPI003B20CEF2